MSNLTVRLAEEKERLRGLSDQEIIKEFLALGKEFSELKIKLSEAKEEDARRKRDMMLTEKLLEEDESMDTTEEMEVENAVKDQELKIKDVEDNLEDQFQMKKPEDAAEGQNDDASSVSKSKTASPSFQFDDPSVPEGWGTRMIPNGAHLADRKIFKSPCGRLFYSRRSAKQFMACHSEKYSQEDVYFMEHK